MLLPVVIAGGSGSRLWPMSRGVHPKQFLNLDGDFTMLQATLNRVRELSDVPATIICNEDHRFMVAEQVRQAGFELGTLLLEPVGRNTAPAIALATLQARSSGEDPILLVLPADHVIRDQLVFCSAVRAAEPLAADGFLVTFGIVPTCPETGYGYVKAVEKSCASPVAEFVEKPDLATAASYVESGDYYWNSGMFMFRASRYLEELRKYRPDILNACEESMASTRRDMDFTRVDAEAFGRCPQDSIDYAVMEKTAHAWVVPLDAGWSDVGSWSALWDLSERDDSGNVLIGDVVALGTSGSYIWADHKLVATVGIENAVVIETKDAVLVAHRDSVQDVKMVVDMLKAQGRDEHRLHREVYRPWGKYDSVDGSERYQVKRITVKPGEKLSLQMHHHRAEHWIVVAGTAKVRRGDEEIMLSENESTYIPIGTVHSLENPGKIPLELIEVQSGSYLGEDDIVRFEDRYGRV